MNGWLWLYYLPGILFLLLAVGAVAAIVWLCKSFYAQRAERQKNVEQQRQRNGGEYILEWQGSMAQGQADPDFGALVVEVPARRGGAGALFYQKGLVAGKKRLAYSELKDVVYVPGEPGPKYTAKAALRDSAVLWLYPKKGAAFGLRGLSYVLDDEVMQSIRRGLGF